ncbi:hypothetical protein F5B20DRAFT_477536 [Whalleya microplaca]|nr:hypothetical protein F5B20DRAFT_477536 [Whalleya microplaca]
MGLAERLGISKPRSARQTVHTFSRNVRIIESKGNGREMESQRTVWHTRGWTFQEDIFSRRKLYFENGWMRWECDDAVWCEVGSIRSQGHLRPDDSRTAFSRIIPNLGLLQLMISSYNRRDLTYPEDALHAIGGCFFAMSRSFVEGFIPGLPEAFFYAALLWNPYTMVTRRVRKSTVNDGCLPSWSWAGWEGSLDLRLWTIGFMEQSPHREPSRQLDRVKPLVT